MIKWFLRQNKGFLLLILFLLFGLSQFSFAENRQEKKTKSYFSLGTGFGIPYGIIGINCELTPMFPDSIENLHEYFSLSIGLGYCPAGIAYSFGFRFYPTGRKKVFQPRLSGYYGVIGTIDYYGDKEMMKGICFASGLVIKKLKFFTLDFEVIYLMYVYDWEMEDVGSRFKISFGIRRQF